MWSSSSGFNPLNRFKSATSEWSSLSVTPNPGALSEGAGAHILAHIGLVKSTPAFLLKDRRFGVVRRLLVGHRFRGFGRIIVLVDVRIVRTTHFEHTCKTPLDAAE